MSTLLLVWLCATVPLRAQTVVQHVDTSTATQPDTVFVSLDVEQMSLGRALKLIEQQAGISIVYRDDLVDSIMVSISFEQLPYMDAMQHLMRGQQLKIEPLGAGQFVVVQDTVGDTSDLNYKGIIRDAETQQPLPGASVHVSRTGDGLVSNNEGKFILASHVLASDTLVIRHLGYEPFRLPVREFEQGAEHEVALAFKLIELPGGVVSDTLYKTVLPGRHAGMYALSPNALIDVPATTSANITNSLSLLPGIAEEVDGALSIRSGNPSQHLTLLDAIPLYFSNHSFGFGATVSASMLETINLFKGGFPATYGGATTGVIALKTRPGDGKFFHGSIGINGLKTYGYANVPLGGVASVQVAYQQSYSQLLESKLYRRIIGASHGEYDEDGSSYAAQLLPQSFSYSNLQLKTSYAPSSRDQLSATYHHSLDGLRYGGSEESYEAFDEAGSTVTYLFDDDTDVENRGGSLQWMRDWSSAAQTRVAVSGAGIWDVYNAASQQDGPGFSDQSDTRINSTLKTFSASMLHMLRFDRGIVLEGGLWYNDNAVGLDWEDVYRTVDSVEVVTPDAFNYEERGRQFGANVVYNRSYNDMLNTNVGLRYTYDHAGEKMYLEPRLFVQYALTPQLSLQGAWGKYRQFLSRLTYLALLDVGLGSWFLSDKETGPTTSVNRAVGLAWDSDAYRVQVELYHNRLSNLLENQYLTGLREIDHVALESIFSDVNGLTRGLEVTAQKNAGRLKGWAAYTIARAERWTEQNNGGERYRSNLDRRRHASLVTQYTVGRWKFALNWRYSSGRPFTQILERPDVETGDRVFQVERLNTLNLPATHQMNASINRTFLVRRVLVEAGATLLNVYNRGNLVRRHYDDFGSPLGVINYVSPGFTPTFSLRIIYP